MYVHHSAYYTDGGIERLSYVENLSFRLLHSLCRSSKATAEQPVQHKLPHEVSSSQKAFSSVKLLSLYVRRFSMTTCHSSSTKKWKCDESVAATCLSGVRTPEELHTVALQRVNDIPQPVDGLWDTRMQWRVRVTSTWKQDVSRGSNCHTRVSKHCLILQETQYTAINHLSIRSITTPMLLFAQKEWQAAHGESEYIFCRVLLSFAKT